MDDVRATEKWVKENCPLTYEKLKQYSFVLYEEVGRLKLRAHESMILRTLADLLTYFEHEYGNIEIDVVSDAVSYRRFKTRAEVRAYEEKLSAG